MPGLIPTRIDGGQDLLDYKSSPFSNTFSTPFRHTFSRTVTPTIRAAVILHVRTLMSSIIFLPDNLADQIRHGEVYGREHSLLRE